MSGVSTPSRRLSRTTTRTAPPSRRKRLSCSSAQRRVLDSTGQQPHALAAVAEREDEEPRAAVLARLRVAHHRPLAVVDLRLPRPGAVTITGCASGVRCAAQLRRRSASRSRTAPGSRGRRPGPARSPSRCGRGRGPARSARGTARTRWRVGARPAGGGHGGGDTAAGRTGRQSRWTPLLAGFGAGVAGAGAGRRTAIPAAFRYALAVSRRTPVASSMRRSDQPSRPSARTCCCLSSLKTLVIPAGRPQPPRRRQRLGRATSLAGFQVSITGRFWVSTEASRPLRRPRAALVPLLEEGRVRAPGGATLLGEDNRVVVVAERVMQSPGRVGQQIAELVDGTPLDRRRRPRPFDGGPQPLARTQSWGARTPRAARSSQTAAQASVLSLPRSDRCTRTFWPLRCTPRTASTGTGLTGLPFLRTREEEPFPGVVGYGLA